MKTIFDIFGENSTPKTKCLKAKICFKFNFVSLYKFLGQLVNNEKNGKFCPKLETIFDIFGEKSTPKRKYVKAKIYSKFDFVSMYKFLGQLVNNEKNRKFCPNLKTIFDIFWENTTS